MYLKEARVLRQMLAIIVKLQVNVRSIVLPDEVLQF